MLTIKILQVAVTRYEKLYRTAYNKQTVSWHLCLLQLGLILGCLRQFDVISDEKPLEYKIIEYKTLFGRKKTKPEPFEDALIRLAKQYLNEKKS